MSQLHEVLAVEKSVRARNYKAVTDLERALQDRNKLTGITRTYRPLADDGDQLPSEYTQLQVRADEVLRTVAKALTELFDITLTKDFNNQEAVADIELNDRTIATAVPVSYLLFLEKQLNDVSTIVGRLPVLDPAEKWQYDANVAAYTTSTETTRTKKNPRNHVKAAATDKHPAQVDVYFEDQLVGYWTTTKLSGALPQVVVDGMKDRVAKLSDAVKMARQKANGITVTYRKIGQDIFEYVLNG